MIEVYRAAIADVRYEQCITRVLGRRYIDAQCAQSKQDRSACARLRRRKQTCVYDGKYRESVPPHVEVIVTG